MNQNISLTFPEEIKVEIFSYLVGHLAVVREVCKDFNQVCEGYFSKNDAYKKLQLNNLTSKGLVQLADSYKPIVGALGENVDFDVFNSIFQYIEKTGKRIPEGVYNNLIKYDLGFRIFELFRYDPPILNEEFYVSFPRHDRMRLFVNLKRGLNLEPSELDIKAMIRESIAMKIYGHLRWYVGLGVQTPTFMSICAEIDDTFILLSIGVVLLVAYGNKKDGVDLLEDKWHI